MSQCVLAQNLRKCLRHFRGSSSPSITTNKKAIHDRWMAFLVVEMTGFEPAASSSRTKRATKLRYISILDCTGGKRCSLCGAAQTVRAVQSPACGARNACARCSLRRISTATPLPPRCIRHRRRSDAKPERSAERLVVCACCSCVRRSLRMSLSLHSPTRVRAVGQTALHLDINGLYYNMHPMVCQCFFGAKAAFSIDKPPSVAVYWWVIMEQYLL